MDKVAVKEILKVNPNEKDLKELASHELGGGRDLGHAGADRHPAGQPQSLGPVATTSASTPGREFGAVGGGGEGSQHVTSSLLGPLASPTVVVPGQGLLGGGVVGGGEGSSQVNAFSSVEAKKLAGSNQATLYRLLNGGLGRLKQ